MFDRSIVGVAKDSPSEELKPGCTAAAAAAVVVAAAVVAVVVTKD